jgi:ligand-binding sensor domain-containing protein
MSAFADTTGSVWFGGADGVVVFQDNGTWKDYPKFTSYLAVVNFALSPGGDLFAAGCAGVYQLAGDTWQVVLAGESMPWCATRIAVAADGSIWVNQMDIPQDRGHGVLHITDNSLNWYGTKNDVKYGNADLVTAAPWGTGYVNAVLPREDGSVWFATKEGVFVFDDQTWSKLPDDTYGPSSWMTAAMTGPDGDVWFGTPLGFARFDGQEWISYELSDGSTLDIFAIAFDDEGTAWLSALEGIGRFDGETLLLHTYDDGGVFAEITRPDLIGMSISGIADSLAFGPDGALWMPGGPVGIIRFDLAVP